MKKTYTAKAGATALATLIIVSGLAAAPAQADTSSGNAINTYSRADVAAAYKNQWLPTTTSHIDWTGDANACDAGSESADSLVKGAQAVNFYRGLAGLDSISLSTSQNTLAQQTALLMEANGTISHTPSSSWNCYTALGAQGASTSNLHGGGGYYYIDSASVPIKAYMDENGSTNAPVGHRRWILNPDTVTMGMGTTKGFNALNVAGAPTDASRTNPTMIGFPGSGYFPQQLEPNGKWSVSSDQGVDFSAASVSVNDANGKALGVIKLSTAEGYGPNTISFQVQGLSYAIGTGEEDYTVTVSNMKKDGLPFAYTYTVRLFDGTVSTSNVVKADPMPTLPSPTPTVTTVYPDYPALGATTYSIPTLAGVVYKVNGVARQAGTYTASTLINITAEAASSAYKISGVASWSKDYTQVVAQPITVTPKAPTFNSNSYVIPYQDGVDYKVNGGSALQGTYTAGAPITITAVALSGYKISGTASWSKDFSPVLTPPLTEVTPKAPLLGSTSYTIPSVAGVEYLVNNAVKSSGTYSATSKITINARAKSGYTLSGTSTWTKDFTVVRTPIAIKAASLNGSLGKATSGEIGGLKDGGIYQTYQGGVIHWSPKTGAHVSKGGIRNAWASTGYERGRLGYPISDEITGLKNGGVYQKYQGGAIYWSSKTGAHVSKGAIRSAWGTAGYENGSLGYPTTDEIGGLKDGGVYQKYQGGVIHWSPKTGAHVSKGAIRNAWASTGYERGSLGYPTSNEITGLKNGGVYQKYQGGAIYWSPKTGAHVAKGGIRNAWAATGSQNGRLGYPTSNEYVTSRGHVSQNYQGGTIRWSSAGTSIVYK